MPAFRIVIDERERNSGIPDLLRKSGVRLDFSQLAVGDYIVAPEIAVERKTVGDLISSIYDGRLYLQCSELVKHFQKPVVVIQGDIADLEQMPDAREGNHARRLVDKTALAYDALATVAADFRIPIIHTPSSRQTAQILISLASKGLQEGKAAGPLLRKIKKENPIYIQQLSVLASIPGVGEKLAARMLLKFRTPHRALNATAAELATIPGFGNARAERVRKVLDMTGADRKVMQRTLFDSFAEM
ncbi:MAG TPA: ERCC4 domain-containing protein [Nitrososphaera sp.]